MVRVLLILSILLASCSSVDETDRGISSTKKAVSTNIVAGFGNVDCLANGDSSDVKKLDVNLSGANGSEKSIVRDIIASIRDMAGDQQAETLVGKVNINFKNYLRQREDGHCLPGNYGLTTKGAIDLARKCHPKSPENSIRFNNDHLRGSLIHELGHVVGNRAFQGKTFYQHYNESVKRTCKVSTYTTQSNAGNKHSNRNEEFAEVWAAYIYATDRLKSKCRKAHDFMRETVFNNASHSCEALK